MNQVDPTPIDAPRTAAHRQELAAIIARHCREDGQFSTPVPGLIFFRLSSPSSPMCTVVRSIFAVTAQGAKRIALADEEYGYDSGNYLITSVGLPLIGQVTEASPSAPYLGLALELDPLKIAELMNRLPPGRPTPAESARGVAVSRLTPSIAEAVLRLARLVDRPADVPVLAPLLEQELLYFLLTDRQGGRLRDVVAKGSLGHRVSRAIHWVNEHYSQPMAIDALAASVSMSRSSLYHHFKVLTSMSPLQYQKALRLQEARRLMLVEELDAAAASHRVGYESPSQFSREYRRMFGAPPLKDIAGMRVLR